MNLKTNNANDMSEKIYFLSSSNLQRSLIRNKTEIIVTTKDNDDAEHLERLKLEEETAFVNLGKESIEKPKQCVIF